MLRFYKGSDEEVNADVQSTVNALGATIDEIVEYGEHEGEVPSLVLLGEDDEEVDRVDDITDSEAVEDICSASFFE